MASGSAETSTEVGRVDALADLTDRREILLDGLLILVAWGPRHRITQAVRQPRRSAVVGRG